MKTTFRKYWQIIQLLIISFIFIINSDSLSGATYYVATNGNDGNPGTISAPFASLNKAWTIIQPGDIIYMRGGTYSYNSQQYLSGKNGTSTNLIKVWAYPGEYPVITKGPNYTATVGLYFSGNYVHFKSLEIKGFVQTSALAANLVAGFWVINASNNIFENLNIHDNGMGLRISGASGHNKILNSDFYNNQDPYSTIGAYENADGLQIAFLSGIGDSDTSWVTGCRFWWNSDDGFDCYNNNGVVIIDNCWSFWNGYVPGTYNAGAGGNGFKLGPTSISLATQIRRKVTRSVAYYNRRNGFNQNNARCKMELYNNTSYLNGWKGFALSDDPYLENLSHTVKNNIGFQNGTYNAYISSASTVTNNTFLYNGNNNTAYSLSTGDFVSLTSTGIDGPRQSDGSLPILTFLQLTSGSDLIDKGVYIGLSFSGSAPDLGAFEFINNTSGNLAPTISNQSFQVNENSINGTVVGTVVASDPNAGQVLTYSILSGNTNNAFTINATTGVISVATSSALNYESITVFNLTVNVQDNGTGNLSSQATITVNINNINEPPVIANQSFSVNENTANGSSIGSVVASDPDAGQTLTYSIISGNTNGAFAINSSNGSLIVSNSSALNYEVLTSIALIIKVQDNGTGTLYSQATVTINILNVNESPILNAQSFNLNENTVNGASVGIVAASDPDAGQTLSYSILSGNTSNAFAINASTGLITVSNTTALNYESTPTFALIIKVLDNGNPAQSAQNTITINLLNINEPPVANDQVFSVTSSAAAGTVVGTIVATDPDGGQQLTYSILSGNTNSAFIVNSTTGIISVNNSNAVNYSTNPVFNLVIKVTDNGTGNLSDNANIIINVLQPGNQPPVITNQSFSVEENAVNGTVVGTVIATDPNAGQVLTYSILSGNTNSAFSINSSSGVLSISNSAALNYETIQVFYLVVKVQDNGTGNLSSQATITINLINVNEPPIIVNQSFSVNENTTNGTTIGTVVATDPDAGQSLSYTIVSGNTNGACAINSSTGVLIVVNSSVLNYETLTSIPLIVKVQDNGSGAMSSQATVTINILNVNETPLIAAQSFSINENSSNGVNVGTVVASDPDAGQTLSYSILSGNTNNAFAINSATGLITVSNSSALNYESTPSFTLVIKVLDNGTPSLSAQSTVTINLLNVNEPPVVNDQVFSIISNSAVGTVVGTVIATDPDAGQQLNYTILSGNTNSAFALNSLTGVITVNNSSAVNYSTTPVFSLVVKVNDNGTGNLSDNANITINVSSGNLPPVITNQAFSVAENSPASTVVGTVVATDPNAGQTLTYSIISGNTNNAFSINATTGLLTVSNSSAINYEVITLFSLIVKVQDNGAGSLSSQAIVNISVTNVNETPVITSNQSFSIAENSANGTLIGTVIASDPDAGQVLTYTILSGNTNNAFTINSSSGVLSVANSTAINYEALPTFSLVVKAQDNGTPVLSGQSTVTVNLINVNEVPVANDQSFSIMNNSAAGTIAGTIIATDPDAGQTLSYSIISGNTSNAFLLNSTSGVLSVNNSSAINYTTNPLFALVVKVTDNGTGNLSDNASITVNVIQSGNQAPVIANQSFTVNENSANGTAIGTVVATDPNTGQTLTYSILSGNTNSAFSINTATGLLSVANSAALNYEVTSLFSLVVKVQDNGTGNLSSQATVTINLNNLNEPPVIANQTFTLNENASVGTQAGIVVATDPDAGQALSFTILSGNTSGAFSINSSTGKIIVTNSSVINYETNPSFSLVVKVQDNGSGTLSSQATVTINLINLNEPPVISNQSFSINENSPNGTYIGTVIATDPDAGQTLSFTILSGNTGGAFAINSSTGSLIVVNSAALNYEVLTMFNLTVKAQDNGTGTLSSQATIVINVLNLNDSPSVNNQAFTIEENSLSGTSIGTVEAYDEDSNQLISYQIIGGNQGNAFYINAATGKLLVANSNALDYETSSYFNLLVSVSDNWIPNSTSLAEITINILDVNEMQHSISPYTVNNYINPNNPGSYNHSPLSVNSDTINIFRDFRWNVYPNPTKGDVYLELPEGLGDLELKLSIFNTSGHMLLEQDIDSGLLQYIDLNRLPGGTYIVILRAGINSYTRKLIVN